MKLSLFLRLIIEEFILKKKKKTKREEDLALKPTQKFNEDSLEIIHMAADKESNQIVLKWEFSLVQLE